MAHPQQVTNQVSSIDITDRIDKKQVKYLNKDFSDFKRNLIEFTKFYFTDTYQDFSDASPGSIFLDMASYIGDVLSYYTDHSFKENLLAYAEEKENVISLAQGIGYKPRVTSPAHCKVIVSALVPATTDGNLDTRYLPKLGAGTSFTATTEVNSGHFITEDVCDFSDVVNRKVKPYSLDDETSLVSTYVVSKTTKVISATVKTIERVISSPTKFLNLELADTNIVDIKSVVDAEGNTWNEVDNLAQDYIFQDSLVSTTAASAPLYTIKTVKTNRRFVVRLNRQMRTELVFGSGTGDLSDVYENPDYRSVYDENYLQNMTNVALDTLNFTNSNSFGLAPGNTTLTIKYRVAGGLNTNVGAGTINEVADLLVANEQRVLSTGEQNTFDTMLSSISVANEEAARGGGSIPTTEQIRQSALGYINAQARIVTATDYEKRILSMPAKYGSVDKAFVLKDDAIGAITKFTRDEKLSVQSVDPEDDIDYVNNSPINTNINLYVMGFDANKRLTTLNSTIKSNIKQFLKGYRMLTDRINIVDAFRVAVGVEYSIVVYKGFNNTDVLVRCSDSIRRYFDIDYWQINQPILKDDLLVQIARIDGVQSVPRLELVNKYQQVHGSDYPTYSYDLKANTKDGIVYPSADPCIFELRYPQVDIVGTAVQ